jgi:hypothetical protein
MLGRAVQPHRRLQQQGIEVAKQPARLSQVAHRQAHGMAARQQGLRNDPQASRMGGITA